MRHKTALESLTWEEEPAKPDGGIERKIRLDGEAADALKEYPAQSKSQASNGRPARESSVPEL
jgi:hypothetical protein